jgi:hypothetical protein
VGSEEVVGDIRPYLSALKKYCGSASGNRKIRSLTAYLPHLYMIKRSKDFF